VSRVADEEVVRLQENYYILATSSRTDDRTRVLKHGDTFAVFDRLGDLQPVGLGEQGLYHDGTRFLSRLEVRAGGRRPLLLSSTVKEDNDLLTVDLTNPDIPGRDGELILPRGQLHLFRTKFLWRGACYERIRVSNFGLTPVDDELVLQFEADFADIFEVRGAKRERRGRLLEPLVEPGTVQLGYRGLDEVVRRTRLAFEPAPAELSGSRARFELGLPPRESITILLAVQCESGDPASPGMPPLRPYEEALSELQSELRQVQVRHCGIHSTNAQLNDWTARSMADLQMMITQTDQGPYPYAGVPWFSTPFGRDAIITALELLWLDSDVARGVLKYLAATQASEYIPERDAQPGKILHEARRGEMAALGEVPFGRYYGSVDSTPLFLMLAGATFRRTGDRELAEALWPNVVRALAWIDSDGDPDRDGFVEYARQSGQGLVQQGWKDSHDSVFHADGTLAEGPIALCEVQGYVYAARLAVAELADALGHPALAEQQRAKASALRAAFEDAFWSDELGTYVLALDGRKRPCQVRTSNAGHALYTGIASRDHARATAHTLVEEACFSGWGIRTLASSEARYNPMSYHNGSVWPHDNALIAAGFARYQLRDLVLRPFEALFAASLFVDLHRLPELFCGFPRRPGEGPTLYPIACAPQSWAAGAAFMLLQACLGIEIDGAAKQVSLWHPILPEAIPELRITNLRVGDGSVDLLFENHPHDVGLTVLRRRGNVRVVVVK
jgi:glycogen debranching enzyme